MIVITIDPSFVPLVYRPTLSSWRGRLRLFAMAIVADETRWALEPPSPYEMPAPVANEGSLHTLHMFR